MNKDICDIISIITIVYNGERDIENTILSVISQTYPHIEYIIIDGGSTDGTVDIIKKYEDKISYWISEPDGGIYDAMNKGIIKATGKWINFINSGDKLFNKNIIEEFVNLHSEQADIIYGDTVVNVSDIEVMYLHKPEPIELMQTKMIFGHPSSFVRASLMKEKLFDTTFKSSGDYNFFFQCYKENKVFQYLPISVAIFDYGTGMSNNYKINRCEDARIHGVNHHLSWKLSYIKGYVTWRVRLFFKRILPSVIVKKYYMKRGDKIC